MRKQRIVLLDEDALYAARFATAVNGKKSAPYEVCAFTDEEELAAYLGRHRAEVLLLSERFSEVRHLPAAHRIILSEAYAGDTGGKSHRIRKYQSASGILREIVRIVSEEGGEGDKGTLPVKAGMTVLGIFSPVGRCGKTALSQALALRLAAKRAVLHLDLGLNSSKLQSAEFCFEKPLDDLIYHLLGESEQLVTHLSNLVRDVGGASFLPSVSDPQIWLQVSGSDWEKLFQELQLRSHYEVLILDLGALPLLMPQLLDECDRIYVPYTEDAVGADRITDFRGRMEAADPVFAGRFHYLPVQEILGEGSEETREMSWLRFVRSGMPGSCVESLIAEDLSEIL